MKQIRVVKEILFDRIARRPLRVLSLILAVIILCIGLNTISVKASPSVTVDLDLECKSAILMEASSGKVLYEQSADAPLPPASVTKVMTLLIVMEAIESKQIAYSDKVRASANAASMGGSQIYLEEGEEMSVEDLLKSVVIASANDAAVALAEYVGGSEEAFVAKMNKKAETLGMKNTHFENTNGLDDTTDSHLTSARDIALMSRELIKYPKITELSSIWMDNIRDGEFTLSNTNRLVRFYKGATGLKTGSTAKAGFCISASAKRDGMELIAVIMGAPSRDVRNAEAAALLDFGFANYAIFKDKGGELLSRSVTGGMKPEISLATESAEYFVNKSELSSVNKKFELPEQISAPVKRGDIVGHVVYSVGEKTLGKTNIVALEEVEKISFFGMLKKLIEKCASFA